MALMPRHSYQRNENGDLEVMPLPTWVWVFIIGIIGGMMLLTFFGQYIPDDYQIEHLKLEEVQANE